MQAAEKKEPDLSDHKVVSREEWLEARKELLEKERELTHFRDDISRRRRELPWVKVEKDYVFDTPDGEKRLGDLFDGRSQLFVYHFMLAPDSDHLCDGCSYLSDHVDSARQHFEHADLSYIAISRATLSRIEEVKERMGWKFRWVSSGSTDFNYDYHVSFTPEQIENGTVEYNYGTTDYSEEDLPGMSVFYKNDKGEVFHTYSAYARGGDILLNAYNFLDMAPKGRSEDGMMSWVKLHDEYNKE